VIRFLLRRALLVLSAGAILMFFSENMFWARFRPGQDSPQNYLSTYIAYCLAGYALLAVLSVFRVRRPAAVFLSGAVFGWLLEGVVVGTVYESLPFSISFTGLAWHALISVGIGIGLLPEALTRRRELLLPVAVLIGWFYGAWAVNWNANPSEYHAGAREFGSFVLITTMLLSAAYFVFLRMRAEPVRILPAEGALLALVALFFFGERVAAQPVAGIVLPALLALTFAALWRNRRDEPAGGLLAEPLPRAPLSVFGALILIFPAALLAYLPALLTGSKIQTNVLFYLVLTPAGFILYGVSWLRIFLVRRPPPAV
jgi:hypothetical protein